MLAQHPSLPASDLGSTAAWGSKRINPRPQSCLCLTQSGCLFERRQVNDVSKLILLKYFLETIFTHLARSLLRHIVIPSANVAFVVS